jgi:hypothetical protein
MRREIGYMVLGLPEGLFAYPYIFLPAAARKRRLQKPRRSVHARCFSDIPAKLGATVFGSRREPTILDDRWRCDCFVVQGQKICCARGTVDTPNRRPGFSMRRLCSRSGSWRSVCDRALPRNPSNRTAKPMAFLLRHPCASGEGVQYQTRRLERTCWSVARMKRSTELGFVRYEESPRLP